MSQDPHKRKKKRDTQRKHAGRMKSRPLFLASTPSSSIPPISFINQSMSNNRFVTMKGKNVEINLSQSRVKCITRVAEHFSSKHKDIHFLNLSQNTLTSLPEWFQLDSIRSLSLYWNNLTQLQVTQSMKNLVELNLSHNRLNVFPGPDPLSCMPSIKRLYLNNNAITAIPPSSIDILKKTSIAELNVAYNKISSLPVEIGQLSSLEHLNISDNELEEMPTTILLLNLLLKSPDCFNVQRNKLHSPPQNIADLSGLISIKDYFLNAVCALEGDGISPRGTAGAIKITPSSHLRLVVVGNEGAGKSALVQRLGTARFTPDTVLPDAPLPCAEPAVSRDHQLHVLNSFTLDPSTREVLGALVPPHDDLLYFPESITVNIYDFEGQADYHTVSEMFFSESSLQMVVFDLSNTATGHDCDVHVQYWVDLIQARAPGSSILIVATYVDELSPGEVSDRLALVQARLAKNETLRLSDLRREIRHCKDDPHHLCDLKKLVEQRPHIYYPIVPFACGDENSLSLKQLAAHISRIASPRRQVAHPLRIINLPLPNHYMSVHVVTNRLRNRGRHFCTIAELDEAVREFRSSYDVKELPATMESTENAVVYWASVGEVVWFPDEEEYDNEDPNASYTLQGAGDSMNNLLAQAEMNAVKNRAYSESAASEDDGSAVGGFYEINTPRVSYHAQLAGSGGDSDGDADDILRDVDLGAGVGAGLSSGGSIDYYGSDDNITYDTADDLGTVTTSGESRLTSGLGDPANISLSEYVILSPLWLNIAIRGVMDRKSMENIEKQHRNVVPSEPTMLHRSYNSESIQSKFMNGVVDWRMVKKFLKENKNFNSTHEFATKVDNLSESKRFALTFDLLKKVLTRLTLVIPIKGPESTADNAVDDAASAHPTSIISEPHEPASDTVAAAADLSTVYRSDVSTLRGGGGGGSVVSSAVSAETAGGDAMQWQTEDNNNSYLLPALLAEHNLTPAQVAWNSAVGQEAGSVVPFAQKGWIRLERRFTFSRFVPSAIVPRIIGKMYTRYGAVLSTSPAEDPDHRDGSDNTTCWRSAFIQEYGECRVWILFEEDNSGILPALITPGMRLMGSPPVLSPRPRLVSKDITCADSNTKRDQFKAMGIEYEEEEEFENEDLEGGLYTVLESGLTRSFTFDEIVDELDDPPTYDNDDNGGNDDYYVPQETSAKTQDSNISGATAATDLHSSGRVVQLRIVSFGHLQNVNGVVASLDKYNDAVQEILSEYRGVSQVFPTTLCPVCLLKQLPAERCGQIHHIDRDSIASSLEDLCSQASTIDEEFIQEYRSWERRWMETIDCPLNKCLIKPEFMVSVPERLAQAITPEEQFRSLTEYVRNDIINRSLDTKHQMTRADPNKLRSATARVFPVFAAHQVYFLQEFFKGKIPADRVPEISLTPARILSGTMVALDAGVQGEPGAANVSAVLTAFRLHKAHDTACVALYFLIGTDESWLYLAKYINQPALSGRDEKDPLSDASLLELIAPIVPIQSKATAPSQFRLLPGCVLPRRNDGSNRIDSSQLGREFTPLPLQLPRVRRVPADPEGLLHTDYYATDPAQRRCYLQVEQVVQVWGYGQGGLDFSWARVVHQRGEHFLANVYSEEHLAGGPVLDSQDQIVSVVSSSPYKKGTHLAYYLASLNDLECC